MVVSKLVYNGQPVGLRFSEIPFKKRYFCRYVL